MLGSASIVERSLIGQSLTIAKTVLLPKPRRKLKPPLPNGSWLGIGTPARHVRYRRNCGTVSAGVLRWSPIHNHYWPDFTRLHVASTPSAPGGISSLPDHRAASQLPHSLSLPMYQSYRPGAFFFVAAQGAGRLSSAGNRVWLSTQAVSSCVWVSPVAEARFAP